MRTLLPLLWMACTDGGYKPPPPDDSDTGPEGVPNLVLETDEIDFGGVLLGESSEETLNLQNNGTGTLDITALDVRAPFTVTFGSLIEVAAGATYALEITYEPDEYGRDEEVLRIGCNDPDMAEATVQLVGGVITDADADGYDSESADGPDCNDDDASIHPGAVDDWYDGVDSDCDGRSDYDQDEDGYESSVYNSSVSAGGGDCQDVNADIHPGAEDAWYDGVDSDCQGNDDYDQDYDTSRSEAVGRGSDCDDLDDQVNPSADEQLDLKDNDCNGDVDHDVPAWNSDWFYTGHSGREDASYGLATADLDDDDCNEVLVGAPSAGGTGGAGSKGPGWLAIYSGCALPDTGGDTEDGVALISGVTAGDAFGYEVARLNDWDGDDLPDLAVAATGASGSDGTIYVLLGGDALSATSKTTVTSLDTLTVTGTTDSVAGEGLVSGLDLDGDGLDELVGTYQASSSSQTPTLFVIEGGSTGSVAMTGADARFSTDGNDDTSAESMPAGGDINRDGYKDLLFCNGDSDVGASAGGAVWILWGQATAYGNGSAEDLDDVATRYATGAASAGLGRLCAIGDDMDRDGAPEIWVASSEGSGAIYALSGGADAVSGHLETTDALVSYTFADSAPDAVSMAYIGDWDDDGVGELAVGVSSESSAVAGRVWIYGGGTLGSGLHGEDDAMATIEGDEGYDQSDYGLSLPALPGDIDGDDLLDWVAGDPGYDSSSGAVYLSLGLGRL